MPSAAPWSTAWSAASRAFYARQRPGDHFRTATHVGPLLGGAIARLVGEVDLALGSPASLHLVDVGAGSGELLAAVLAALPAEVGERLRPVAVDVRPRPEGLDPRVSWVRGEALESVPHGIRGLLVAHELLDDVPCDVVEVDGDGVPRLVLVDPDGVESLGPSLTDDEAWDRLGLSAARARAWLSAWWPLPEPGARAEIGLPRDELWAELTSRLDEGTALAVDYGHLRESRPVAGTLTAYRDGDLTAAVPDGSRNLTAHVAVDALASRAGATMQRQREALIALGVDAALPDHALAARDTASYLDRLAAASQAAELLDPAGLGAFWWIRTDV